MRIEIRFTEPLLGSAPRDQETFTNFVGSKAPAKEEVDGDEVACIPVDEQIEKGSTGFMKEDGRPFVFDYVIRGFMKGACGMLRMAPGTASAKLKAYKKRIDGLIFVKPRRIFLILPRGVELTWNERPLRAETAQGPRVCLARSEQAPAGTRIECEINLLDQSLEAIVHEWLDYGALCGLGQWRNGSYGRFEWKEIES